MHLLEIEYIKTIFGCFNHNGFNILIEKLKRFFFLIVVVSFKCRYLHILCHGSPLNVETNLLLTMPKLPSSLKLDKQKLM